MAHPTVRLQPIDADPFILSKHFCENNAWFNQYAEERGIVYVNVWQDTLRTMIKLATGEMLPRELSSAQRRALAMLADYPQPPAEADEPVDDGAGVGVGAAAAAVEDREELPTVTFKAIDGEMFILLREFCDHNQWFDQFTRNVDLVYVPIWSDTLRLMIQIATKEISSTELTTAQKRSLALVKGYELDRDALLEEIDAEVSTLLAHRKKLKTNMLSSDEWRTHVLYTKQSFNTWATSEGMPDLVNLWVVDRADLINLDYNHLRAANEWFRTRAASEDSAGSNAKVV